MNVLVVDDNANVRDFISQLLLAHGYKVDTAINGLDGFEKAQQGKYQLFIIDHLMPLMNGVLLSKNIKQTSQCSETPIVFITTQPQDSLHRLPEFTLFAQVLNKPLNEESLLNAVSSVILSDSSSIAL